MPAPKGHPRYGGRHVGSRNVKTLAKEAGKAKALKLAEITAERVMLEIARVGVSDIGQVFDSKGQLQPIKDLPKDVRAAIASVKTLKTNVVSGDGQQEETREVKLWDKLSALTLLAKHFGLVTEKHDVTVHGSEALQAVVDRIRGAHAGAQTKP